MAETQRNQEPEPGLVAKKLRMAREQSGLSQVELGDRLNMSHVSISERERGITDISAEELRRFAEVLERDAIKRLLAACEGKHHDDKRDLAIILLILDSGWRRHEIANIEMDSIDWRESTITVQGKFKRTRTVPFGRRTAVALDRYLRARRTHKHALSPRLFLGQHGPLTGAGIGQMLTRRSKAAGFRTRPHVLRHTWAHMMLEEEVPEGALMILAGWRSRRMVDRYARKTAERRAQDVHRKHSPGDRL